MMKKNEIKMLNRFIKETHMTKEDFADEAGITVTMLNRAMKSGNVSEEVANEIFGTIVRESLQYKLLTGKDPRVVKEVQSAVALIVTAIIVLFLILINFMF